MSGSEAGEVRNSVVDPSEAHAQANMVQEIAPVIEKVIKTNAEQQPDNTTLQTITKKLGETGYLELASRVLERNKTENPRLYEAQISRQDAVDRFAKANASRRLSSGSSDKPLEELVTAGGSIANTLIEEAADNTAYEMVKGKGILPDEDYEEGELRIVSAEIASTLKGTYTKGLSPAEKGALVEGVFATLVIKQEEGRSKIQGKAKTLTLEPEDIISSLDLQERFNKLQPPASQPASSGVK
jgi:hypothetical protein